MIMLYSEVNVVLVHIMGASKWRKASHVFVVDILRKKKNRKGEYRRRFSSKLTIDRNKWLKKEKNIEF